MNRQTPTTATDPCNHWHPMLREGLRLHGAGNLSEAARCYQQAHLDDADDPEALLMLGILARQSNQPVAAVELSAQAVRLRPRRAHYYLNLGLAHFAAGDYAAAEAAYANALALDGRLAQAWCSLGELAQARQNSTTAEGCFQLAAAANPRHWRTALAHGNLLARQKKFREAAAVYASALLLAPNEPDLHLAAGAADAALGLRNNAISHYQRAISLRPNFAEAHLMLGNTLFDAENFVAAALCYQQAIHHRPLYAKALCNLGNTLFKLNRMQEAVRCFERALLLDPTLDAVHNNLGNTLVEVHDLKRAESCFRTAIELDPTCAKYHNSLGNVLLKRNALREAESAYRRALSLDPNYAIAHVNLATALMKLGQASEMVDHYQRGLSLDPTSHGARYNLSIADLRAGRLGAGWLGHESRWSFPELRMAPRPFARGFGKTGAIPQWLGEPIAGKTILLHAEQGFGDTIQFARYAPLVAALGARVILEVQPPLRTLFAELPGVDRLIVRGDRLPCFDLHCPLLSLPLAFATELDTIPAATPYLAASAESIAAARTLFPSRTTASHALRVGLVWAGNPKHAGDSLRSIPLRLLAPLARIPGLTLISLQKGLAATQLREVPELALLDADAALNDFADSAALISTLDLLITVDTAAAHLAGALGTPVWLLLPHLADWRWLEARTDSPWYPTARLFRQPTPGDWPALISHVAEALHSLPA